MEVVFDIETRPDRKALEMLVPPFDPSEVKLGNLIDPKKIKAKIEEAERNHQVSWERKASLCAELSTIACCSVLTLGSAQDGHIDNVDVIVGEYESLQFLLHATERYQKIVGFNIRSFDLPYSLRRMLILALKLPPWAQELSRGLPKPFVDLFDIWRFGQRWTDTGASISLKRMSLALGVGDKDRGNSRQFWKLWDENREAAIDHAKNDVLITMKCAQRMGVL